MDFEGKILLVVAIAVVALVFLVTSFQFHEARMADKGFCKTTVPGRSDFVWVPCPGVIRGMK